MCDGTLITHGQSTLLWGSRMGNHHPWGEGALPPALELELDRAGLGYGERDELPDRILRWIVRGLQLLLVGVVAVIALPANRTSPLFLHPRAVPAAACDEIVAAAEAHADSVGGWLTERHRNYPVSAPWNPPQLSITLLCPRRGPRHTVNWHTGTQWLSVTVSGCHGRLSTPPLCPQTTDFQLWSIPAAVAVWNGTVRDLVLPAVAHHHGRPLASLRLRDVFIVKYTGDGAAQNALRLHRDASVLSFNLALSSPTDYTGGGTTIPLLDSDPTLGGLLRIGKGDILTHQSSLLHAGAATTTGTRYLLVGFVDLAGFWDRHGWHLTWGLTAGCVNVSTVLPPPPPPAAGTRARSDVAHHGPETEMGPSSRMVCPGLLLAAGILREQLYAELADAGGEVAGVPVLPVVLGLCCTAIALLSASLVHDAWELRRERHAWVAHYHPKDPKQA